MDLTLQDAQGSPIMLATAAVRRDEPVFILAEINKHKNGTNEVHRYQIMYVKRGDQLAEWWDDLGVATSSPPFRIYVEWEHTVAELLDMADALRNDDTEQRLEEIRLGSTLLEDYVNQAMQDVKIVQNQSVFGPGQITRRNSYSPRR